MTWLHLKRAIDVVGSSLALIALTPIMACIAVCVRLDSPGPMLFRQTRVGKDNSRFSILKFRTMVDGADEPDQASARVVTAGRDPRITRAGRILRGSSLDELPQLINILRGEMSLIGPRPIIPQQLQAVPAQRLDRFSVRPGLTGLAQVGGRRGLDWLDQLALDSQYVREYGPWLDLQIILRTVFVVTSAAGVYGGEGSNWRAHIPNADTPKEVGRE